MADGINGVITKNNLIGTWTATQVEKDYKTYYTFVLEANGNFVYTFSDGTNVEECKGTWKINNLGFISFNASGPYKIGKFVMFSVYDKEDKSLYLGGNDDFLGDGLALKKSK